MHKPDGGTKHSMDIFTDKSEFLMMTTEHGFILKSGFTNLLLAPNIPLYSMNHSGNTELQFIVVSCSAVQCSELQCSTVQYITVRYSTEQWITVRGGDYSKLSWDRAFFYVVRYK